MRKLLRLSLRLAVVSAVWAGSSLALAKVDVVILTGVGGHESAAAGIEAMLDQRGLTHKRLYTTNLVVSQAGEEELQEYLKQFETNPEALNRESDAYVWTAKRAKSISELYFAQEEFSKEKFLSALRADDPSVLLSVYYHPNEMLQRLYEEGDIHNLPVGYIATDYGTDDYLTRLQMGASGITRSFGPSAFIRAKAISNGVKSQKIIHSGMPINPAAMRTLGRSEVQALRAKLGLVEGVPTLFLGGGSFGVGRFDTMLASVRKSLEGREVQVVVAVGNSKENLEKVKSLAMRMPPSMKIVPLGFTPDLPMIQKYLADVVITKAGGLTTTELTYMRKNMVLLSPPVNMERANLRYFVSRGLALSADVANLGEAAKKFLDDAKFVASVRAAQELEMKDYNPSVIADWAERNIRRQEAGAKPRPSYSQIARSCEGLFN